MNQLAKKIVGVFFLLLGVIGILLPVMPGAIFIVLGLALLGPKSTFVVKIRTLLQKPFNPTGSGASKSGGGEA